MSFNTSSDEFNTSYLYILLLNQSILNGDVDKLGLQFIVVLMVQHNIHRTHHKETVHRERVGLLCALLGH